MDDNKTQGGGASRRPLGLFCCPFVKDFLRNIRTERLKNKFPHNKRPEGSSKPTRVATHPRLRQYRQNFGVKSWKPLRVFWRQFVSSFVEVSLKFRRSFVESRQVSSKFRRRFVEVSSKSRRSFVEVSSDAWEHEGYHRMAT